MSFFSLKCSRKGTHLQRVKIMLLFLLHILFFVLLLLLLLFATCHFFFCPAGVLITIVGGTLDFTTSESNAESGDMAHNLAN